MAKPKCPKNLKDCYKQLNKILSKETKKDIKDTERETPCDLYPMSKYHHGLGTQLRNNWVLWHGSELAKYFQAMGIQHPDDMSGIILHGYWCYLKKTEYDLQADIERYQKYWKEMEGNE